MNDAEYKKALKAARMDYDRAVNKISTDFAFSNNTIKIGDFVTDHVGTVKVEKIGVYTGLSQNPKCTYFGTCYTKKGAPYKDDKKATVYQKNVLKVNSEVYKQ